MSNIEITYIFDVNSDSKKEYSMEFESDTMSLIPKENANIPEWVNLDFHKCSHCPLQKEENSYCPIARNLSDISAVFKDEKSYKETVVQVVTKERAYTKEVQLQKGLFGIFGLIMSTSGCPHMNFLKAMARFHLPFSSSQETMVRSISLYLLSQFFRKKRGEDHDMELKKIEKLYENVNQVNLGFIERVRSIATGDAGQNAIVVLDSFASLLSMEISSDFSAVEALVNFKY